MTYREFQQAYGLTLNKQQEQAVQAVDGPVLLLAVPGSGKTTVLVNRLGYLIYGKGIPPEQILTVTYTVAATRDMKERFESVFGDSCTGRLEFRTINGISQKILQYYAMRRGKTVYAVADKEAQNIVKQVFHEVTGNFATESDIKDVQTGITYVKNMRLKQDEIRKMNETIPHFSEICQSYNKRLKEKHLIDYDDQIVYAIHILENIPEVLAYFQEKYRYLCVDEAQDTSKIQHDMIALLAGKSQNLFMVGDEDQSIYGFRAAYPKVLTSFEKDHPGARVLLMESNYRSAAQIVEAADHFIQKNKNRHKKRVQAVRKESGRVRQIQVKTRNHQYYYLAKMAVECDRDTAILYRNHESALPLIDLLDRKNIPYRIKNNDTVFFTNAVVLDISAFIRLAERPWDADSFLRIYYKMGAGISKAAATYAVNYQVGQQPLLEAVLEFDGISGYTKRQCRALLTHFRNMSMEGAGRAIFRITHYMGYGEYMEEHGMDAGKADILKMLGDQEPDLMDFLDRLDELKEIMTKGVVTGDCPLTLSTIHSSKGLEYERVYLCDAADGVLPSADPRNDQETYEEERRLFYVGVTRAKNELYVFSFADGTTSPFTKELFANNWGR